MSTPKPRRTPLRRATSVATNLLLVVVALAGLGIIVPGLMGYQRYVITGGSMEPTIHKGSLAFDRVVDVQDLEVGDVITYRPPASSGVDHLVTHRIVSIEQEAGKPRALVTKGDANPTADPWRFQLVAARQPVVERAVPYVGWAFIALADRHTRTLVIGIPAGIIALLALAEAAGTVRRDRRETRPAAGTVAPDAA
jgi:signal peptidase